MAVLSTVALVAFTADAALGLVTKGAMIHKGKSLFKKRDWREIMEGGDDELPYQDYVDIALNKLSEINKIPKKKKEELKQLIPADVKKINMKDMLEMGKSLWNYRKVIKFAGKTLIDNPKLLLDLALTQESLDKQTIDMIAKIYGLLMKINKRRDRL